MLYWLLFAFVAVGAKLILALITIYLLLPVDRRCNRCDEETLLMQPGRTGRAASRALLGTLQWRWCPRCEWEGMARSVPVRFHRSPAATSTKTPTRR